MVKLVNVSIHAEAVRPPRLGDAAGNPVSALFQSTRRQ